MMYNESYQQLRYNLTDPIARTTALVVSAVCYLERLDNHNYSYTVSDIAKCYSAKGLRPTDKTIRNRLNDLVKLGLMTKTEYLHRPHVKGYRYSVTAEFFYAVNYCHFELGQRILNVIFDHFGNRVIALQARLAIYNYLLHVNSTDWELARIKSDVESSIARLMTLRTGS